MARVKYLKSTLREVIFQVRFPKMLKLVDEQPATFQEQIMGDYPIYNVQKRETVVEVNGKPQQKLVDNNHSFISQSGRTKIDLTSTFLAVSTLEYDRYEAYKKIFENVLAKFYGCYAIPGIQRIGLRYKNFITRSKLGLEAIPWSELLDGGIIGPMAQNRDITQYKAEYELKNGDQCFTRRHIELLRELNSQENTLMLDCDYYYSGFFKKEEVCIKSDSLHDLSLQFIESSHKAPLLDAMQPQDLEPWLAI